MSARAGSCGVLVPVKAFAQAKDRLAPALGTEARAELVRQMAERVITAAAPLPVSVVCDDADVADWAAALGAGIIWSPGRGLNRAVAEGVDQLGAAGVDRVIVAHADLPLADDLGRLDRFPGLTLVPDRRRDGTNVLCVPARAGFRFAYGPGSFDRHYAEGRRLALPTRVVLDTRLAWDVDQPSDLAAAGLPASDGAALAATPG